jgi:CRISPR-associated endonuclease/helicase Cas3
MSELSPSNFVEFFSALYQNKMTGIPLVPMTWQLELAEAACLGRWPDYICVPTGAGKTSTLDIALFALAFQANLPAESRTAAMRIFLVVDRRTVVSEAFYRARHIQQKLTEASDGILKVVSDRLKSFSSGSDLPFEVVELRGGIYRDPGWCNSLIRPTVITSTVDQVGSRLLFRGYGVSESSRPIQAALIAHDSLIILDEAHISRPFSETLNYVKAYQAKPWNRAEMPLPLRVVEMTATPPTNSQATKIEISDSELADPTTHIGNIVNTSKLTTLEVADSVKGSKAPMQLAAALVAKAIQLVYGSEEKSNSQTPPITRVVGIMCNMVATAKEVRFQLLKNKQIESSQVQLIIGAMRPIDRDEQTETLRRLISTGANRNQIDKPLFVVATQCIEVGADYDFDVLITEAAPLDSLIQRFGRLNRAGRSIDAVGHVVMRGDRLRTDQELNDDDRGFKLIDPIYGNAVSYTWNWLSRVSENGMIDFGIARMKKITSSMSGEERRRLSMSGLNAPVLLPAHLDLLCQTTMPPWPDPDVSLWLHGPQRNEPEVQVCWRADLIEFQCQDGAAGVNLDLRISQSNVCEADPRVQAISLCPPSAAECLSLPLRRVIAWLTSMSQHKKTEADLSSDLPTINQEPEAEDCSIPPFFQPVAWRGLEKSIVVAKVQEIRPNDTLVFPVIVGGWSELGFLPDFHEWLPCSDGGNSLLDSVQALTVNKIRSIKIRSEDAERLVKIDRANEAYERSRNRLIVRLHPGLTDHPLLRELFAELKNEGKNFKLTKTKCKELVESLPEGIVGELRNVSASRLRIEYYAEQSGIVVTAPKSSSRREVVLADDDGCDVYSNTIAGKPVELAAHLFHVREEVSQTLEKLPLAIFRSTLIRAAETHDWGKTDSRFQAMLFGGDVFSAAWDDRVYAKSAKMPSTAQDFEDARLKSDLPRSFRHEMLSASLIEAGGLTDMDPHQAELLLHLVTSHHGYGRPWAPVCIDPYPPHVDLDAIGLPEIALSEVQRQHTAYHRIDSKVMSRFWSSVHQYGWWGVAFLESVLRLADRRASQIESSLQASESGRRQTKVQKIV